MRKERCQGMEEKGREGEKEVKGRKNEKKKRRERH